MNTRINTVFVMVATLGLVLSIGTLTTIHSQRTFAVTRTGINGGMCTTNNCNANGVNSIGGQGRHGGNGGSGMNGGNDQND
jgi:hypothetical protein